MRTGLGTSYGECHARMSLGPVAVSICVVLLRDLSRRSPNGGEKSSLDESRRIVRETADLRWRREWDSGQIATREGALLDALETTRFDNERVRTSEVGGESGIRTLTTPLDSVTYRFHYATVAVNASDAVAHCPPLPAGSAVFDVFASEDRRTLPILTTRRAHTRCA